VEISGFQHEVLRSWVSIAEVLVMTSDDDNIKSQVIVIETYPGVNDSELITNIKNKFHPDIFFNVADCYKSEGEIDKITYPDVTGDRIFGFMTRLTIETFFDDSKLTQMRSALSNAAGLRIVYGTGASFVAQNWDTLVYADMARWEIQQRMRRKEVANLGTTNFDLEISRKYKRAYFVDWRVADRIKRQTFEQWDYVLDTNTADEPKMINISDYKLALAQVVNRPFRVVPFFDPGPWGGQWMKEVCDLDRSVENFAWCFDCVPEENSLLLRIGDATMEIPSNNLVFFQSKALLGERVFARFGAEFPIRFDFLDTMGGGNLSLQVHPLTEYIREHFGMFYTQDESYYLLEASDNAVIYLGMKEGIDKDAMMDELRAAQNGGSPFDADKYVAKWPAKKHDHFLIPAGTVHCSGENTMVLEISATPYIFTFKLWDWGRLGMDGLPRPINIEHGSKVIQWDRNESWVRENLVNAFTQIDNGNGWVEERTGLHEFEFIETRRHWFTEKVFHQTGGSVNVLNLIEGSEAIVESPTDAFEPFIVHFAETFIIPENVREYSIRPYGESEGHKIATIKAFVKS
jgi:mannose-6-phosphate isomerase class I